MPDYAASGRSLCGKTAYRVKASPRWSDYCYCESCRRFTGALVTSWQGIDDNLPRFQHSIADETADWKQV